MKRLLIISFIFTILIAVCAKQYGLAQTAAVSSDKKDDYLAPSKERKILIDLNEESQTIEHFGASDCWAPKFVGKWHNEVKKNQIADYLFSMDTLANGQPKGIGLSIWRFNIGAGSFEQGRESGIPDEWRREECFLKSDNTYDWNKQSGQQWFLNAAKMRGVNNFLAFSNSPPVQYTVNGKAYGQGNSHFNLESKYNNKFAAFLVDVVDHFNSKGYNMHYISPFNEPQWNWGKDSKSQEGSGATNTEMANFVKILGPKLKDKGLPTKIALGEAAEWNFLNRSNTDGRGNQLNDFFNSSSANYIGTTPQLADIFSAHSYYTTCPDDKLINFRKDALKEKNKIIPKLRLWQTEFGVLGDICGQFNGSPRNMSIDYGLYVAKVIHHDLSVANVSAWHWWLAIGAYNYSDALVYVNDLNNGFNRSLLKTHGVVSDSKQLWCFGNYSRFIRPGMIRVGASFGGAEQDPLEDAKQMVSAYKDKVNKKIVIVIVNSESLAKRYSLAGFKMDKRASLLNIYTTNASSNLVKTASSADEINIPAKSVVTLIASYK